MTYAIPFKDDLPKGSYYNTLKLSGEELKERKERVNGQTNEVLSIFANNPQVEFSAWDVMYRLNDKGSRYPITSIRRAINTLFKRSYIVKTGKKIAGPYSENSYTYKLNPKSL